ncbi:MAG: DUF3619 family protein [Betaproteobacteria bacterium]|nr:DUF3619 family protein [Betaproteobacteria bacterium]MDH4322712.1 DUF3619 family protein [Betaproteobacteria bacterium]
MDHEAQFALRVRQQLNLGARVNARIAARLRAAREQALAHHDAEPVAGLALADHAMGRIGGARGLSLRVLLPLAILAVAFFTTYAWQQTQRAAEVEELDAQLLSGDLPIDAYLDQGFAAWLKRRASLQP